MELWSLMHFLMPHVFQSHREFKEWFANPLSGMIEGSHEYNEGLIRRLHKVYRITSLFRQSIRDNQLSLYLTPDYVFCVLSIFRII